jgi:RNA polymerase sigma-70 factor (ECF subfamily)
MVESALRMTREETAPPGEAPFAADLALAARLAAGDEAAFTRLVEELHGLLVRVARTFVSSAAVADEVAQETWLAVLEGLAGYQGRSPLRKWIIAILVHRARTRGAREARSVPFSAFERGDEGPSGVDPARFDGRGHWRDPPRRWNAATPEKLLLDAEARALVERTLDALPPGQRAVVALRDLGGWDAEEVCNALELSETNQRVLLHRGRSVIRAALERYLDGK